MRSIASCKLNGQSGNDRTREQSNVDSTVYNADDKLEMSEGGAVGLNNDDDDGDDIVDRTETNSISGEDDLIKLRLRASAPGPRGCFILDIPAGTNQVKVWTNQTKSTSPMTLPKTWDLSSNTVPTNLWIEGLVPSTNGARDVELTLTYSNDTVTCADTVAVTVCELFYACFDYDAQTKADPDSPYFTEHAYFTNYVAESGGVPRDTDEYILIRTEESSFFVNIVTNADAFAAALHTEGGYVAYCGHANGGVGPAFVNTHTNISDFFNIGTETTEISYPFMVNHYPSFVVSSNEIRYGVTNYNTSKLGYERFYNVSFTNPPTGWPPLTAVDVGEAFPTQTWRSGSETMQYYYDTGTNVAGPNATALLVSGGAADKPKLKYRKFFIDACFSGVRFTDVLDCGVLFYNYDPINHETGGILEYRTRVFFEAVVDGKSNGQIKSDLNAHAGGGDPIYEYHNFAP